MVGPTILHYKILERRGKGSMGEAWKAKGTQLRRTVALFSPAGLASLWPLRSR